MPWLNIYLLGSIFEINIRDWKSVFQSSKSFYRIHDTKDIFIKNSNILDQKPHLHTIMPQGISLAANFKTFMKYFKVICK